MKVSVSLPDEDVRYLDEYALAQGLDFAVGRSASGGAAAPRGRARRILRGGLG